MEKNYTLVWVPVENAEREDIPFSVIPESGRLVYKLPSTLVFGHLELNGVDITGYFQPEDDSAEYICRPWMTEPAAPLPADEPEDETE